MDHKELNKVLVGGEALRDQIWAEIEGNYTLVKSLKDHTIARAPLTEPEHYLLNMILSLVTCEISSRVVKRATSED